MNTVSITVYAKQGDWDSDHLWFEPDDEALVEEIRSAKERDLHVVLIPRVALDHAFPRNRFLWHGMIMPKNDGLLESWFAKYRDFVVHWAAVAEREKVDVYGLGSEMNALASTVPVDKIPDLEDYYLDSTKQAQRRADLLDHESELTSNHLWASGGTHFDSLDSYLDAQTLDQQAWADRLICHDRQGAPGCINGRRRRIEGHWRDLIRAVRRIYGGKITYAANFDQYQEFGFWDDLDFIGVNAYFPLRDASIPMDPSDLYGWLEAGWKEVFCELIQFRRSRGLEVKPFVFTEIGYTYRKNTTLAPWAGSGFSLLHTRTGHCFMNWDEQPVDFEERALALRALHAASTEMEKELGGKEARVLAGLLYWKLSTDPEHLEVEPFVHILGRATADPLSREWDRFTSRPSLIKWLTARSM